LAVATSWGNGWRDLVVESKPPHWPWVSTGTTTSVRWRLGKHASKKQRNKFHFLIPAHHDRINGTHSAARCALYIRTILSGRKGLRTVGLAQALGLPGPRASAGSRSTVLSFGRGGGLARLRSRAHRLARARAAPLICKLPVFAKKPLDVKIKVFSFWSVSEPARWR